MKVDRNLIWLELRFMGRSHWFEMEHGGRPVGVGSGLCSDVRIDGAGVGLVHFEFLRMGDAIWLMPNDFAHVRLNAAHLGTALPLPRRRSLVEFLSYEIEVVLHSRAPTSEYLRSRNAPVEATPRTLRFPHAAPLASE